eukprot:Protomagalhaensia_wolfi_Nauph_80__1943@NODE_2220_length_1163_cov_72_064947_g1733_i0_p1_GENE_NODE_2220_length_1163_cov_72_064947_g1733_i0NODE_2220_length_1163_cov_72_064947_g1733_i0_p1_ORF_typecomplete_len315_score40_71UPF0016/PF01169_19/7_8e16UPF0016/PF01169_19/1_9e21Mntp/PF02659_15/0_00987TM_GPCR_Srb/PF02175_16/0_0557TM_GPCR_Srb/PF02175_16/4_5e03OFeT_1/PF16955_5/2_3e02OFeT_1/PF16955_5/1_4OFeT_1/PF16955_5/9_3PAP2/PF01569_21/0_42PAP2/PF01569_21/5_9e02_NODE_2220_length_1163_cov_72_064947_g1733_i01
MQVLGLILLFWRACSLQHDPAVAESELLSSAPILIATPRDETPIDITKDSNALLRNVGTDSAGTQFASFGSSTLAAFSLTLVTELGDRTFFVAAMLATQYSKWRVWLGASLALWVQTVGCVLVGSFFHRWQFKAAWMTWPLDDYLAGIMLTVFGVLHIQEGLAANLEDTENASNLDISPDSALLERKQTFSSEQKRRGSSASWKQELAKQTIETSNMPTHERSIIFKAFWLVMAAELGDRSMFSTIALAAAQNPWGVALGAITGHALVTFVAVTSAALLGQFLNERVTNIVGGLLFAALGLLSITEGLVRQGVI